MSKDHFPVNDKTIADVNAANARAYDSTPVNDAEGHAGNKGWQQGHGATHSRHAGGHKLVEGSGPNAGKWAVITKGKHVGTYNNKTDAMGHIEAESTGDHVRESKQEHGEDAAPVKGSEGGAHSHAALERKVAKAQGVSKSAAREQLRKASEQE